MRKQTKGTKTLKASQSQAEKPLDPGNFDVSSIERASILDEGPHQSYGNPLHSTALEEDLSLPQDAKVREKAEKKAGGPGGGGLGKATPAAVAKQKAPSKREDAGGAQKRGRKRKSIGEKGAAGPGKSKAEKENNRGKTNRKSSSSQTPSPGAKRARTRKSSSSQSADRQEVPPTARKSSSSDGGAEAPVSRRGAGSSVVLDSFLAHCQTYKETVESPAVRRAIDMFSSTIKEQITEMITTSKELRAVKKDNAKVNSLIKRKRTRLLDAKYELVRAEQQLGSLKKEKVELEQRLANVRRGRSFLHGIRDLTTRYLAHRRAHPTEKEQYGASSLPALLLETKSILTAEDHLRKANNRLEARMRRSKQV